MRLHKVASSWFINIIEISLLHLHGNTKYFHIAGSYIGAKSKGGHNVAFAWQQYLRDRATT
jgi:hypothetical protein